MRERGFALGVRGHGSGEGERPGEDGEAFSLFAVTDFKPCHLPGRSRGVAFKYRRGCPYTFSRRSQAKILKLFWGSGVV